MVLLLFPWILTRSKRSLLSPIILRGHYYFQKYDDPERSQWLWKILIILMDLNYFKFTSPVWLHQIVILNCHAIRSVYPWISLVDMQDLCLPWAEALCLSLPSPSWCTVASVRITKRISRVIKLDLVTISSPWLTLLHGHRCLTTARVSCLLIFSEAERRLTLSRHLSTHLSPMLEINLYVIASMITSRLGCNASSLWSVFITIGDDFLWLLAVYFV